MIIDGIKAFVVCVDYGDLISITLPHNQHHFESMVLVTTPSDQLTISVCEKYGVECIQTSVFYDDGALFNKWKALNLALSQRASGWTCLLDADILLPKTIDFDFQKDNLYVPRRRVVVDASLYQPYSDCEFFTFPLSRPDEEFAGYCQIFHSEDPCVGPHPWHQQNWRHAGGADSFFWMKWPNNKRIRPNFEVLHFGQDGLNWGGRVTPMIGGEVLTESEEREEKIRNLLSLRRGKKGLDRFRAELL